MAALRTSKSVGRRRQVRCKQKNLVSLTRCVRPSTTENAARGRREGGQGRGVRGAAVVEVFGARHLLRLILRSALLRASRRIATVSLAAHASRRIAEPVIGRASRGPVGDAPQDEVGDLLRMRAERATPPPAVSPSAAPACRPSRHARMSPHRCATTHPPWPAPSPCRSPDWR